MELGLERAASWFRDRKGKSIGKSCLPLMCWVNQAEIHMLPIADAARVCKAYSEALEEEEVRHDHLIRDA